MLKKNVIKIPEEFHSSYDFEISKINAQSARFVTLIAPILFILFFFTGIDYLFNKNGYIEFLIPEIF
jgi:hypothetical protein